jgi:hypothetical protein
MDKAVPQSDRIPVLLTLVIQACFAIGLFVFLLRRDWENVFLTLTVILLIAVPAFLLRQQRIHVPPFFQFIAAMFVFLSLFLGSAQDFFYRIWWWDMVLHLGSGFLLGIVGWVALFLLNQTDHVPRGMRPGFVCFFGVTFAVFVGVLWEAFEFLVDNLWPSVNMMSNETGVSDTMLDLMVDLVGATIVALMGYSYFKTGRFAFVIKAVRGFVHRNPRLFRKRARNSN